MTVIEKSDVDIEYITKSDIEESRIEIRHWRNTMDLSA